MGITAVITLIEAGTGTGPFNLYSDLDGYVTPFETNISRADLLSGYPVDTIPDGTEIIRIISVNENCNNFTDINILCFNFLPQGAAYLTGYITAETYGYFYGAFNSYSESGLITTFKHLIKLNLDLTVDISFDVGTGFNQILYGGSSIAEYDDGKILVTGTFTAYQGVGANRVIRLNTDGSRDNTFVIGSGFNDFTQVPVIRPDQKAIITGIFGLYNGVSSPRLARLNTDGTLDTSLVLGSGHNNTTLGLVLYPDNSMVVTGYFSTYKGVSVSNGISKIDEFGTIDPSFDGGSGFSPYSTNFPNYPVKLPGETSFYVSGYFTSYKGVPEPHIIKLTETGDKDLSFDAGIGFNAAASVPLIVWGDKLLIQGAFTSYNGVPANLSIILNPDGSILWSSPILYRTPTILGNNLYGAPPGECLQLIYTFVPPSTTTTTSSTTLAPTTTTTTTSVPTTTTTSTAAPVTTTTSTTVLPSDQVLLNYQISGGVAACGNTPTATYWITGGVTFATATNLWQNAGKTIPAANGDYSDGITWRAANAGVLLGGGSCP